jgi:NAD(P)-dependent dehydrogenase (short-subunit alcohol dehydrogenase family)
MKDGLLRGKIALITGGGRGIGRATAQRLALEGATVVVCARTKHELKETIAEIRTRGGEASYIVADLAVPDEVMLMVSEIIKMYHRLDILINNASLLGPRVPISEYPFDKWKDVIQVNLNGLFLLTQEVLKSMIARKSGCIINLTSSVGRSGRSRWGAYAVSKFGVEGLTQVLAEEVREHNISVMAINPGATRTSMRAEAYPDEDPATLKSAKDVAEAIYHLIRQDQIALSGKTLNANSILEERKNT